MTSPDQPIGRVIQTVVMILAITPAVALMAVAMFGGQLPYGFFILTRFVVAATCFGFAWWIGDSEPPKRTSTLIPAHITLGILYQPLFRIHLTREIWWWVNLATVGFLCLTVVVMLLASNKRRGLTNLQSY